MSKIDIKEPEFRASLNEVCQLTFPQNLRKLYGIEPKDEILLEFKGKITKNEKVVPEKQLKK